MKKSHEVDSVSKGLQKRVPDEDKTGEIFVLAPVVTVGKIKRDIFGSSLFGKEPQDIEPY